MPLHFRHSLAFRIIVACGLLGAGLSAAFALAVFVATQVLEDTVVIDMLASEAGRFDGSESVDHEMPYRMHAYVGAPDELPTWLRGVPPGFNEVEDDDGIEQHVFVRHVDGRMIVVSQDATLVEERQEQIGALLVIFALLGAYLSVWVGWLLSRRVIAPLRRLADDVGADAPFDDRFADDELGRLATAVDRYREELRSALERERNFSADASHELRTPLTIIRGAVEVMRADPVVNSANGARLARIERAVGDMAELIDSFLTLARGRSESHEPIALAPLISAIVELERTANADQRIAVVTTIPDSVTVAAPPRALTIVCANLVRNAFRHAPGPLHILLDGDRLVFEDAGAGVGDHRPGRGLSIVARLCEHHGWQFSVTQHAKGMRAAIDFGGDLTQT